MRYTFGSDASDFAIQAASLHADHVLAAPNQNGTAWSAITGGLQYIDLIAIEGGAPPTTDANGWINRFQGPHGVTQMWLDFGVGDRFLVRTTDIIAPAMTPEAFPPAPGKTYMLGGQGVTNTASQTAGSLRLYPVFLPYDLPAVTVMIDVTGAGAGGSTLIPAVYSCDAYGAADALLFTGPSLSTSGIAYVSGAFAHLLPAGWLWVGGLHLSGGGVATFLNMTKTGNSPTGGPARADSASPQLLCGFQNGLAALPNPFAGTYISATAPVLFIGT